ncbi:uncharacterized protein H6S33_008154 [Morchella sextelata]|uniref:uncharacterized protein n=1 Tax=Morchella sextelata TaxID=1174677 RepID=UPI001D037E8C|nr:uncharacterized protein H6S33_008154 [Morchella sextelata]KAH0603150.1 hypothetical protein H6S33_008154 [Morchella sextelata]
MPSPTQDMLNVMDRLRLAELDEDVICISNSSVLATQAAELLAHESTSHLERLLLTITIGIVNQNAILIRRLEELTEEHEKTASQLTTNGNKVDRAHDRISTLPRAAPPPPRRQSAARSNRTIPQLQTRSYIQAAQDTLYQWQQVPQRSTPAKKPNAKEPGRKTLPAVQRRFFATRQKPEPIESPETLAAELSVTFGKFMASQNQVAPVTALTVTINQRGAVTILSAPTVPSSVYATFFEAMTAILNNRVNTEHNPFNNFRPAPTDVDIAIHGIPLFDRKTKEALNAKFPEIFLLASGIAPIATRFLHPNDTERNNPANAQSCGPPPPSHNARSATNSDTLNKAEHTCPVNCNGRRYDNIGCCTAVRAKCVNCDGAHASTSNNCPALTALIENNRLKRPAAPTTPAPATNQSATESPEVPMPDANTAAPTTQTA